MVYLIKCNEKYCFSVNIASLCAFHFDCFWDFHSIVHIDWEWMNTWIFCNSKQTHKAEARAKMKTIEYFEWIRHQLTYRIGKIQYHLNHVHDAARCGSSPDLFAIEMRCETAIQFFFCRHFVSIWLPNRNLVFKCELCSFVQSNAWHCVDVWSWIKTQITACWQWNIARTRPRNHCKFCITLGPTSLDGQLVSRFACVCAQKRGASIRRSLLKTYLCFVLFTRKLQHSKLFTLIPGATSVSMQGFWGDWMRFYVVWYAGPKINYPLVCSILTRRLDHPWLAHLLVGCLFVQWISYRISHLSMPYSVLYFVHCVPPKMTNIIIYERFLRTLAADFVETFVAFVDYVGSNFYLILVILSTFLCILYVFVCVCVFFLFRCSSSPWIPL